jgi:hypothetical protein
MVSVSWRVSRLVFSALLTNPAHKSCLLSIALLPDAERAECAVTIAYQAC